MKLRISLIFSIAAVCLLGACTGRRTASNPVPDGDTVEVVIVDEVSLNKPQMPEIIDIPDSLMGDIQ